MLASIAVHSSKRHQIDRASRRWKKAQHRGKLKVKEKVTRRESQIREIYHAIDDDLYEFAVGNLGLFDSLKNPRSSYVSSFAEIEIFVEKLSSNQDQAYRVTVDENGIARFKVLPLGRNFHRVREKCALLPGSFGYGNTGYWINARESHNVGLRFFWKNYALSEYVSVFLEAWERLGFTDRQLSGGFGHYYQERGKYGADLANDLIFEIRKLLGERARKIRIQTRIEQSRRNFESNDAYIDALFTRTSPLFVVRVDLFYKKDHAANVSVDDARKHRKTLFNNARGKTEIFRRLEGYISKLEYAEERGHHFHIVFFFSFSDRFKDAELGWEIGKYWRDCVTAGRGDFQECKGSKNKYKYLGVGMVKRDEKKRKELLLALTYLTKKDLYLKVQYDNRCRVIDRGDMPKVEAEPFHALAMTPSRLQRIRRVS